MKTFSLLVSVFNKAEFLPKFVESIKSQTISEEKFEVVFADDFSTDTSYEMLKKYETENKNFRVYKNAQKSLGNCRNFLISKATGKYVLLIDPDDYLESELLEVLDKEIQSEDIDIVRYQNIVEPITENKKIEEASKNPKRFCCEATDVISGETAFKLWMFGVNKINTLPWTYCIKRELFDDVKYPGYSKLEDFAITPYLIARAKKVKAIDFMGYHYVQYDSSQTSKGNAIDDEIKRREEFYELLKEMIVLAIEYINKSPLSESVKQNYICEMYLKLEDKKIKLQKLKDKKMVITQKNSQPGD